MHLLSSLSLSILFDCIISIIYLFFGLAYLTFFVQGSHLYNLLKSSNLVRMWYKSHNLHYSIRDCHINILLKIQNTILHLITFQ